MNEPTIETLAQRLDRLERENRPWHFASVLCLRNRSVAQYRLQGSQDES